MSNNWFAFKQFKIFQDKTAMKVGTDGVLLGSWIDVSGRKQALDIGTGTGLIALMLAQRNSDVMIDAIDIDEHACRQARENVKASPWPGRINVFHSSLDKFVSNNRNKYDLIVCNPPYFIDSKKPEDQKRRIARHADELTLDSLFGSGAKLLRQNGRFGIIFPYAGKERVFQSAGKNGLYPDRVLNVRHNAESDNVRVLISFSKKFTKDVQESGIEIETGTRHRYTEDFSVLVRDFYLYVD